MNNHYYVQSRTDFFELETRDFKIKEKINDWWSHEVDKKTTMSAKLLKNSKLVKLRSYFCHAGFDAGVVNLQRGEIKGLPAGTYLNICRTKCNSHTRRHYKAQ